jgi:WD40 repeat protein
VSALAFGADGRTIATGSEDLTDRLWDIADPAHPVEDFILDTRAKVNGLASTPGGDRLVTAGANTARLWLTGLDDALRQTCAPGGDGITPGEWAGIAPDLAPIRSCP